MPQLGENKSKTFPLLVETIHYSTIHHDHGYMWVVTLGADWYVKCPFWGILCPSRPTLTLCLRNKTEWDKTLPPLPDFLF